jgi:glucokinase
MDNTVVLGIDIGGSHVTAALVDLETKQIVANSEKRRFVDSNGSADQILNCWCAVINEAFASTYSSERRIGIAMPGPFDYEAGISLIQDQNKFRALYQMNLKDELAKRLDIGAEHIVFMNDAAAFLQGELFCGAAMNADHVLGLTLGTGLGAAIAVDADAQDAALWDLPFNAGIAEDYLSTRWFLKSYLELTGKEINGVKELLEVQDYRSEVKQLFDLFAINLAEFIELAAVMLNFRNVILGGNISNAYPIFLPRLNKCLSERNSGIVVKIALLKEEAALIGAASRHKDMHTAH